MNHEPIHNQDLNEAQPITALLAQEFNIPIEQVAHIYANVSAELERTARIKAFIGVLAIRRTRIILSRQLNSTR